MTSIAIDRRDGLSSATAMKGPCRVATTVNITLEGLQTIDGVALATDDRVLVKNQTDQTTNGIYVAGTGTWERAKDFSRNRDVRQGTQIYVNAGTGAGWYGVTTADEIVIGTSNIVIAVSNAGPGGDPGEQGEPGIGDRYDVAFFDPGRPAAAEEVFRHIFTTDVTFAASFAGSQSEAKAVATAESVWSIEKNGSGVGTITFATASDTGVFGGAGATFAPGDILTITAPNPRDDTLSGVTGTLAGSR